MEEDPKDLIDSKTAAQLLGVGDERVRQLARDGSLACLIIRSSGGKKSYAFEREVVHEYLAKQVRRVERDPAIAQSVAVLQAELRMLKAENARLEEERQRLEQECQRWKRAISALAESDASADVGFGQ